MLPAGSLGTVKTDIARTFAALNATNEAILYAKSPEELYAKVCEAAFSVGDFLAVAIFLLEPETNLLRFAAGYGDDVPRLRSIDISIVAGTPEGSGVSGQAFRDRKICVSNDFLNDQRSLAWREGAKANQVDASAALPLICNGEGVGVLLVRGASRTRSTDRSSRCWSACRPTFRLRSTISTMRPRARMASASCGG